MKLAIVSRFDFWQQNPRIVELQPTKFRVLRLVLRLGEFGFLALGRKYCCISVPAIALPSPLLSFYGPVLHATRFDTLKIGSDTL